MVKIFQTMYVFICFSYAEKISNPRTKRYADIGSPWRASLSRLKYFVVCPPFITHYSWFFSNILIWSIKLSPKPYFLRAAMGKPWFIESKAISKSIAVKYPLKFSIWYTLIISEIRRPLLPINLLLTWAVWPGLIKTGRTF